MTRRFETSQNPQLLRPDSTWEYVSIAWMEECQDAIAKVRIDENWYGKTPQATVTVFFENGSSFFAPFQSLEQAETWAMKNLADRTPAGMWFIWSRASNSDPLG